MTASTPRPPRLPAGSVPIAVAGAPGWQYTDPQGRIWQTWYVSSVPGWMLEVQNVTSNQLPSMVGNANIPQGLMGYLWANPSRLPVNQFSGSITPAAWKAIMAYEENPPSWAAAYAGGTIQGFDFIASTPFGSLDLARHAFPGPGDANTNGAIWNNVLQYYDGPGSGGSPQALMMSYIPRLKVSPGGLWRIRVYPKMLMVQAFNAMASWVTQYHRNTSVWNKVWRPVLEGAAVVAAAVIGGPEVITAAGNAAGVVTGAGLPGVLGAVPGGTAGAAAAAAGASAASGTTIGSVAAAAAKTAVEKAAAQIASGKIAALIAGGTAAAGAQGPVDAAAAASSLRVTTLTTNEPIAKPSAVPAVAGLGGLGLLLFAFLL